MAEPTLLFQSQKVWLEQTEDSSMQSLTTQAQENAWKRRGSTEVHGTNWIPGAGTEGNYILCNWCMLQLHSSAIPDVPIKMASKQPV